MHNIRGRGAIGSARTAISWCDGSKDIDGAFAPPLTKHQALEFLAAIAKGQDPIGWAEHLGIEAFSIDFNKTTRSKRGRPTKHPRWCLSVSVSLSPKRDADFFRRPLDGLPAESFRGI